MLAVFLHFGKLPLEVALRQELLRPLAAILALEGKKYTVRLFLLEGYPA